MKITALMLAAALFVAAGYAQTPSLSFDVVSIRPNDSGSPNSSSRVTGNRWTATNVTLVSMLRTAYDLQEFQIAGQPRWADLDRFDIVATLPDGASAADRPRLMQVMLRDRFQLKFHREQRPERVYVMTAMKGGHKLMAADPLKCPSGACDFSGSPTRIFGRSVSTAQLAGRLSRSIGVMVIDKTGLSSLFDIELEWTLEDQFIGRGASASPTIFPAIQEQLGLRLESAREPVDVLVVDSVERPSPN